MSALSFLGQMDPYYHDYNYSYSSGGPNPLPAGVALAMILVMFLFLAAFYALHAYFLGRIFKKAGVAAWKAWVPFYNNWVMLELGDQPGFWSILTVIPIVNIVSVIFMYIAMYHIGLKLGKEGAFVLLAIFLPTVWFIWLGIDSSTWHGAAEETPSPLTPAPSPEAPSATPPSEQ